MNTSPASPNSWQPGCDLKALRARAGLLACVRRFFAERGVMEVETPLLAPTVSTDPQLDFFAVPDAGRTRYLQTSPELLMKRLLAAGSGPIYQICKAFRRGEAGRWHNPEFTLLEWYRPGFELADLMDEVADLLRILLPPLEDSCRLSYTEVFERWVGVSWHAPLPALAERARRLGLPEAAALCGEDRSLWLDLLFSHRVQPNLPRHRPVFVCDYPAPLAALARLNEDGRTARRFEVFCNGVELGNGYDELTDPEEQRRRLEADRNARRRQGLPVPPLDEAFVAALRAGLPRCSGVAVGLDRLLMLRLQRRDIDAVVSFSWQRLH
ncbi:EF-P lysine aminoacylase EpmA [Methylomarinovum caldicuralii]|nr:EF-P lysine aminoacylase EpmA [Methylomarinovum caldicuralii]